MQLTLAVGAPFRAALTDTLAAMTVGRWQRHVKFVPLGTDRHSNEAVIRHLAADGRSEIFAAADLTPSRIEEDYENVRRFQRRSFEAEVANWLDSRRFSWKGNFDQVRKLGAFEWTDASRWRAQFAEVDPRIGTKVADALLAQLDIQPAGSLLNNLLEGSAHGDYNACFLGADPHSGDYGLMSGLAQRIDGTKLFEAFKLPALPQGAELNLFADGGWSGGESVRRLTCMATSCEKKKGYVGPANRISMRFGYLTDVAAKAVDQELSRLQATGSISGGQVLCSESGKLKVASAGKNGLAFSDKDILNYVDSKDSAAMRNLCERIGRQIKARRPLGTHDIASTLAFEHSLPKAMLPVLIFSGRVDSHDGRNIAWRPLIRSAHVLSPSKSIQGYHCDACALQS